MFDSIPPLFFIILLNLNSKHFSRGFGVLGFWGFEISEDDCETFQTVNDLVEFIARSFYAK